MKIALVYPDIFRPGGYPRDFRWLSGALQDKGADLTVFAEHPDRPGNLRDGLSEKCTSVGLTSSSTRILENFDIVHFVGFFFPEYLWYLWRLHKPRVVLSTLGHVMPYHLRVKKLKKAFYLQTAGRFIRSRISAFHVFSKTEAKSLSAIGREVRYFVAPLGIFPVPGSSRNLRDFKMPASERPVSLLFFGRNDVFHKGIDMLLRGFRLALNEEKNGLMLTIAGKPWKNSEAEIERIVALLKLYKHVKVRGSIPEKTKAEFMSEYDYLCFLSRFDGPPRPIREAIGLGIPVIISWETNMGEVVAEANAGLVVPLNENKVAEALMSIKRKKGLLSMHKSGAERLGKQLNWTNVAEQFLREYSNLLRKEPRA